jgi:hypothetical protein
MSEIEQIKQEIKEAISMYGYNNIVRCGVYNNELNRILSGHNFRLETLLKIKNKIDQNKPFLIDCLSNRVQL